MKRFLSIFLVFCLTMGHVYALEDDYRSWAQSDERWANVELGTQGNTIQRIGCLVTAISKLMIQAGFFSQEEMNPGILGAWLNENEGLTAGGGLYWEKPSDLAVEFVNLGRLMSYGVYDTREYNDQLLAWIQEGKHLLVNVDDESHWVAIDSAKSLELGVVCMMDSWTDSVNADITLESRYPTFNTVRAYSGGKVYDGSLVTCDCLEDLAGEYVCATESTDLLIRSGHGTMYSIVDSIPKGATVEVVKAGENWAHVIYNGIVGYSSIHYLKKVEKTPVISVSGQSACIGQKVDVTISMQDNPGMTNMRLYVNYDANSLKLVNVKDAGLIGESVHSDDYASQPYCLSWANDLVTENYTGNGDLVTLTFEVLKDAMLGESVIDVSYDFDNLDIFDVNLNPVYFEIDTGHIDIRPILLGDVDNSGRVNTLDRLILTRVLAGFGGYTMDDVNIIAADVNKDGKVNAQDRMILTRCLAQWEGYGHLDQNKKLDRAFSEVYFMKEE